VRAVETRDDDEIVRNLQVVGDLIDADIRGLLLVSEPGCGGGKP